MNLQSLIDELRSASRLDDAVVPPLWSDDQLVSFLNDAVRQVCIRARALTESLNAKVCQYALVPGQRMVKLHPSIIAVRSARIVDSETNHCPLEGRTARWITRRCPRWESSDNGRARYWIPDYQEGQIALDRPAEFAGTLLLTVWRAPLDAELLDIADPDGEPVINSLWHRDLLDWAAYLAFNGKDAETEDSGKASGASSAFEAKVGRLPSATEIRLWGVSRLVGTTAEFI